MKITSKSCQTHRSQSTAMIIVTSSAGSPTVSSTITIVISPACGIPAAPIEAAVAVTLNDKTFQHFQQFSRVSLKLTSQRQYFQTKVRFFSTEQWKERQQPHTEQFLENNFVKTQNNLKTVKNIPSMLIVAPTGMTKRVTRGSIPILSRQLMVIGMVAELEPVPKAVAKTCDILKT